MAQPVEINFKGLSTVPDDRRCADGTLSQSINIICEDEALKPIPQPIPRFQLPPFKELIYIHKVGKARWYIFRDTGLDEWRLYWASEAAIASNPDWNEIFPGHSMRCTPTTLRGDILALSSVGNVIAISTTVNGLRFLRYTEDSYKLLAQVPPFAPLRFSLDVATDDEEASLNKRFLSEYFKAPVKGGWLDNDRKTYHYYLFDWDYQNSDYKDLRYQYWDAVYGCINARGGYLNEKGCIWEPCLLRYALRLYDGSYVCHSAPVLINPGRSVSAHLTPEFTTWNATYKHHGPTKDGSNDGINPGNDSEGPWQTKFTPCGSYGCLQYQALPAIASRAELEDWRDLVQSIDVFISRPLHTYNPDPSHATLDAIEIHVVDRNWGDLTSLSKQAYIPHHTRSEGKDDVGMTNWDKLNSNVRFKDPEEGNRLITIKAPIRHPLQYEFQHELICTAYAPLPPNEHLASDIENCSNFYKIASIDFNDYVKGSLSTQPQKLKLLMNDLTNITTFETLPDEYRSRDRLRPQVLHSYNHRLNLGNCDTAPAPMLPLSTFLNTETRGVTEVLSLPLSSVAVVVNHEGTYHVLENYSQAIGSSYVPLKVIEGRCSTYRSLFFPLWIFVPDEEACWLRFNIGSQGPFWLPLREHPTLNGRYWMAPDFYAKFVIPPYAESCPSSVANGFSLQRPVTADNDNDGYQDTLLPGAPVSVALADLFSDTPPQSVLELFTSSPNRIPGTHPEDDTDEGTDEGDGDDDPNSGSTGGANGNPPGGQQPPSGDDSGGTTSGTQGPPSGGGQQPPSEPPSTPTGDWAPAISESNAPKFIYSAPSKVLTSQAENPFYFPATGRNTVGNGNILAMETAVQALSQDTFGQYPLYVFTTEGIWALTISTTGEPMARQSISRDVCTCSRAVRGVDGAVVYPTARGLMLISSGGGKCLSESLAMPRPNANDSFFLQLCHGCHTAYDYASHRLLIYQPDYPWAYVLSLRSFMWGCVNSSLNSTLNSYPECLCTDALGNLVEVIQSPSLRGDVAEPISFEITLRPFKLGSADALKTLRSVILSGLFNRSDVSCCLIGTRDYQRYALLKSAHGNALRSIYGAPYKAFVLQTSGALGIHDTITSLRLDAETRLGDKLR